MIRNVVKNKRFLLVAGLIIGLVTLFSHSLRVEIGTRKDLSKEANQAEKQAVVVAPSDAVTVNFFTLQVDGFLEIAPIYHPLRKALQVVPSFQKTTIPFFKTLFRFIISPNAP